MVANTGYEPVTDGRSGPPSTVRVQVLGPFGVTKGGRVLPLGGPRQRMLLARLVIAAPRRVSAASLVHDIWGTEHGSDGRPALKTAVNRLRTALGADAIASFATGYGFALPPECIDAVRFERHYEIALGLAESESESEAEPALEELETGMGLWRGQPYEEFADDDWARDEVVRLDAIRRAAEELALELRLRAGAAHTTIADLVRLSLEHPWNEHIVLRHMTALYEAGRAREALDVGGNFTRRLRDDVGLAPSHLVLELERSILDHTVGRESSARIIPLSEVAVGRALQIPASLEVRTEEVACVGRDREISTLRSFVLDPRSAIPNRVALVHGPAGIGKTRVFKELARAAVENGIAVFYGAGRPADAGPYGAVVDAIRPAYDDIDRVLSGPEADALAPMFGPTPEHPQTDSSAASDVRRLEVFDATATALRLAARGHATLLILDDLQWVDPSAIALLRHFLSDEQLDDVCIVLGMRDDELPDYLCEWLDDVRVSPSFRDVPLVALDPPMADALTDVLVRRSSSKADRALTTRVRSFGEGNPFMIAELVRDHGERGKDESGQLPDRSVSSSASPIERLLGARLDRLSPGALEILSFASVIGTRFDREILSAGAAVTGAELESACSRLVDVGILVEPAGDEGMLAFTHALLHDAVYGRLDPARRRATHLEVLAAADRLGAVLRHSERARHAFAALPEVGAEFAVTTAIAAGDEAMRSAAYEDAVAVFERAYQVAADDSVDARLTVVVLSSLADAYAAARRPELARESFVAAFDAAERLDDPALLAAVIIGHAQFGLDLNDVARQLERAGRVLTLLPLDEHALRVRLHCWLAWQLVYGSHPYDAATHVDAAMAEAGLTGRPGFLAAALQLRHAYLVATQADLHDRIEIGDRIRTIRRGASRADGALIGGASIFEDYLELGQIDQMRAALAEYRRLADRMVRPYQMWSARSIRAALALWEGELGSVALLVSDAASVGAEFGIAVAPRAVALQQMLLAWELDELGRYIPILSALSVGDAQQASWIAVLALAHVVNGEHERAADLVETLRALIADESQPSVGMTLAVLGAEVAAALGSEPLARSTLPNLERMSGRIRIVPTAVGSLGPVDRYRALALSTIGNSAAAIDVVGRARRLAGDRGSPLWAGRCAIDEARLLRRRGRPEDEPRVRALVTEATEIGRRHGSRLLERLAGELDSPVA